MEATLEMHARLDRKAMTWLVRSRWDWLSLARALLA
jgi:hypothetical protein